MLGTETLPLFAAAAGEPLPAVRPVGCVAVSRRAFEDRLRALGVPYVAVDEAKRAIFSGCGPTAAPAETFDFLVYRENGPNFLVSLRCRNTESMAMLAGWEKVFGSDFRGVYARMNKRGGVRYVGGDGSDVDWDSNL